MPSKTQLQDGKALILGALFLVDNAPECPEEMSWHDFSDWAIAEHLKRHSYYYHQKDNRELVTVAKMRSRLLNICNNYSTPQMPKPAECDKEFKDKVDVLFGFGRTELLKKSFLDEQGYEKNTFAERRLNKHVSEVDGRGSAKTDGRPEAEEAEEEEEAEEVHGNDTSKTGSHVIVGQERCASELAISSKQPTLPSPSRHASAPLQTSENSRSGLKEKLGNSRKRCEQNGTNRDEQPPPSRDERRQLRSSASVGPQTRPLNADQGISCVSDEANAASVGRNNPGGPDESVPGAKRRATQDHGSQKRQRHVNNATRQDNSDGHEPLLNATTQAERPSKTPSTVYMTKGPEAPQDPVPNREEQHKPQLARLYLDQQGRNMKSLYSDMREATDVVLSSIGKIRNTPSPLQPKPSGPLKALYARCWGPRWDEVRVRQGDKGFFTTPQVMTSLLSAFLYDRVLIQGARLQDIVSNIMEMGGSLGQALLEECDISTRGTTIAKRARMIEAQNACSELAQDDESLQRHLKLEAEGLAKDASAIISPHLDALSSYAELFGLSSDHSETHTLSVFESEFAQVVQKTLHHRLQLLATGCEHAFTWRNPGDIFDSRTMQIDGGRSENTPSQSFALFTVFPGLEIKPMSSEEMESLPDAKVVVKVQRVETGCQHFAVSVAEGAS